MYRLPVQPIGTKIRECDLCGRTWPLNGLVRQRGGLVCPECKDDPRPVIRKKYRGRV